MSKRVFTDKRKLLLPDVVVLEVAVKQMLEPRHVPVRYVMWVEMAAGPVREGILRMSCPPTASLSINISMNTCGSATCSTVSSETTFRAFSDTCSSGFARNSTFGCSFSDCANLTASPSMSMPMYVTSLGLY